MKRWALLAALLALPGAASALKVERLPGLQSGGQPVEVAAEQVLIKFSTPVAAAQKAAAIQAVNGAVLNELSSLGWTVVGLPEGMGVMTAVGILKNLPGVEKVVPNRVLHPTAYPSDPGVPQQYALFNVDAFAAWEYETGSRNRTTVAIIDSGIQATNADLQGKMVNASAAIQSQFFDPGAGGARSSDHPPTLACSHGTQTASMAAATANNGVGIAGMSWGAQLISLRVFANGDCSNTTDAAIAAAIDYAANTLQNDAAIGKLVVNLSIGGPGACTTLPLTQAALTNGVNVRGVPFTISSGNQPFCTNGGANGVDSPANCAGVSAAAGIIPVGATDSTGRVATFSCSGPELSSHGIVAPGDRVLVDDTNGSTAINSGTSFSSPFAAGLVALMLSANPALTPAQIEAYLRGGANSIGGHSLGTAEVGAAGNSSGGGQMNAFRTMRLTVKGTLADSEGEQKAIAFPNPFRLSQGRVVSLSVPVALQGSGTKIKIYTMDGQLVRELTGLAWDGKNADGALVASGAYVFVVSSDKGTTRGRLAVIR